uniref:Uncharacterized protein n=1 Tax=Periophthalmus magnuspinnatus TaxID=409849 RepID=A0A3B4AAM5_9GOBI
ASEDSGAEESCALRACRGRCVSQSRNRPLPQRTEETRRQERKGGQACKESSLITGFRSTLKDLNRSKPGLKQDGASFVHLVSQAIGSFPGLV